MKCRWCGEEFEPWRSDQQFDREECRLEFHAQERREALKLWRQQTQEAERVRA
jgi:hypothetical protein